MACLWYTGSLEKQPRRWAFRVFIGEALQTSTGEEQGAEERSGEGVWAEEEAGLWCSLNKASTGRVATLKVLDKANLSSSWLPASSRSPWGNK